MAQDRTAQVGVIIPFYAQLGELREALQSLLDQDWQDWQAVVVDDLSPERGAADLVAQFADPRLQCIEHTSNLGAAAARNTAVRQLATPWLLTLDSDDKMPADGLRRLWDALAANPQADCAIGMIETFGQRREIWPWPLEDNRRMVQAQILPGPGVLMRRAVWERAGGWCEVGVLRNGNEDWDFWIAAMAGGPLLAVHAGAVTYHYRRRPGTVSVGRLPLADWRTRLAMIQRHPHVFEAQSAGPPFVRAGLVQSALAHWRTGQRRRGVQLAWQAWLLTLHPTQTLLELQRTFDINQR